MGNLIYGTDPDNNPREVAVDPNGAVKTSVVGSLPNKTVKMIVATVVNAQSVAALSSVNVPLGIDGTESEVYLAVNIDQQPWGLVAPTVSGNTGSSSVYPVYWNKALTFVSLVTPALALLLGAQWGAQGDADPTSMSIAKAVALPLSIGLPAAVIYNQHATLTATVTVKVLRIWR